MYIYVYAHMYAALIIPDMLPYLEWILLIGSFGDIGFPFQRLKDE